MFVLQVCYKYVTALSSYIEYHLLGGFCKSKKPQKHKKRGPKTLINIKKHPFIE